MHSGIRFRSRLEARWAAFFTYIGWKWEYEPLDAEGYVPDFLITGKWPFFVEVGPCVTPQEYQAKAAKADRAASTLQRDVLIVGVNPLPDLDTTMRQLACGWLGEYAEYGEWDGDSEGPGVPGFAWGPGIWAHSDSGRLEIFHDFMNFTQRPHMGGHEKPIYYGTEIEHAWATVVNDTQWKPAA